jgi:hypothetical protein
LDPPHFSLHSNMVSESIQMPSSTPLHLQRNDWPRVIITFCIFYLHQWKHGRIIVDASKHNYKTSYKTIKLLSWKQQSRTEKRKCLKRISDHSGITIFIATFFLHTVWCGSWICTHDNMKKQVSIHQLQICLQKNGQ